MISDIISNAIAVSLGMALLGIIQMRSTRSAVRRIDRAAEHFEAASDAHDEFLRKAREHTITVLGRLQQATYAAEMAAGLPENLRISKEVPDDIVSMPTLRPRTPAQKTRARRARRG